MSDAPQRSEQWFAERLGNLTASVMADAMAKTRSGYGASRKNLMAKLVTERLTGQPVDTFTNAAMQRGTDMEPEAIAAYEAHTGLFVEPVGYVPHPDIKRLGASPDGLVLDDGLIEVKCPNTATHIDTILGGAPDRRYIIQMHLQMACTGRQWCAFVSYDDRMPERLQLWTQRVDRDDELIAEIEDEARKFLAELERMEAALWARIAVAEDAA